MKTNDHGYFAALTYDLRVRERLIGAGIVAQPDIERYLTELPELEAQCEALGIAQPAIGTATSAPATTSSVIVSEEDAQANEAGQA